HWPWRTWGRHLPVARGALPCRGSRRALAPAPPQERRAARCSRGLRSDPDGGADETADTDDPDPQALGHRTEGAEADATRRGLAHLHEVGDDVPLALRRDVGLVEHRHRLWAGEHGL